MSSSDPWSNPAFLWLKIFLVCQKDAEWVPGIQALKNLFNHEFRKLGDATYDSMNVIVYLMEVR